jgi:hypothetical protein
MNKVFIFTETLHFTVNLLTKGRTWYTIGQKQFKAMTPTLNS